MNVAQASRRRYEPTRFLPDQELSLTSTIESYIIGMRV
jgi:hypothetical protein